MVPNYYDFVSICGHFSNVFLYMNSTTCWGYRLSCALPRSGGRVRLGVHPPFLPWKIIKRYIENHFAIFSPWGPFCYVFLYMHSRTCLSYRLYMSYNTISLECNYLTPSFERWGIRVGAHDLFFFCYCFLFMHITITMCNCGYRLSCPPPPPPYAHRGGRGQE